MTIDCGDFVTLMELKNTNFSRFALKAIFENCDENREFNFADLEADYVELPNEAALVEAYGEYAMDGKPGNVENVTAEDILDVLQWQTWAVALENGGYLVFVNF